MIESFAKFLSEAYSNTEIDDNQESLVEGGETEDFDKPDIISEDKYLTKITKIVLRKLKSNFDITWNVYPFVLHINGNKAIMIHSENIFLVVFKKGIEKRIVVFKENPIGNSIKSEISISTRKLGFLAMIKELVDIISMSFENGILTEAVSVKPRVEPGIEPYGKKTTNGSVKKILDALCGPIGKSGSRVGTIEDGKVNEYLKLFELYSNSDITKIMTDDYFDDDNPLYGVQNAIYRTGSGTLNSVNGTSQVTNLIHMILCGTPYGLKEDEIRLAQTCWFWGAGKSGKLATYLDPKDGIWKVEESESVIENEIYKLEKTFNNIEKYTTKILNYVKKGGKGGTEEELKGVIGNKRGLFVTGTGGIGKTNSIKKAIEKSGAKENIDWVKLSSAPTEQSIYKDLYRYNNMLIIYDDTDEYFDDESKVRFYKRACQEYEGDRSLDAPGAKGTAGETNSTFYDVKGSKLTRRERYFLEVGTISNWERKKWIENRIKVLDREEDAISKDDPSYVKTSKNDLRVRATNDFEEYATEHQRAMIPNKFTFNGFFIFITNIPIDKYQSKKSVAPHWGALQGRLKVIDISPRQKIVWEWIKGKIMRDAENPDLEDEMRILPLEGKAENSKLKNVINFIEEVMNGEHDDATHRYGRVEFRTIVQLKLYLQNKENSEEDWKNSLLDDMWIETKEREMS